MMSGSSGGGSMSQPLQQMLFQGQPWQQNNSFSGSPFGMLMQRLQQMRQLQQQPSTSAQAQQSMPQMGMSPPTGSAMPQMGIYPPAGAMNGQPPNPPAGNSFMAPTSPIGQLSSIAGQFGNQSSAPGTPMQFGQDAGQIDQNGLPGGILKFLSGLGS